MSLEDYFSSQQMIMFSSLLLKKIMEALKELRPKGASCRSRDAGKYSTVFILTWDSHTFDRFLY